MSVKLTHLFQELRQQGTLQEPEVRQLLETAEADGEIDLKEHSTLRAFLSEHNNCFSPQAHERLELFLDSQLRSTNGYSRADGQTMLFTSLL